MLFCGNAAWRASAADEAARLGPCCQLVEAGSGREAVAQLAVAPGRFSHVLLQPERAGPLLEELLALVGRGDGPHLVALGALPAGAAASSASVIADPAQRGWLAPALATAPVHDDTAAAELSAAEARELLGGSAVRVLFQPMVWLATGRPGGMEALARLQHPERGRLPPGTFLQAAETAGQLHELTRAVVARAFTHWNRNQLRALGMGIGINLPLDILQWPSLAPWLEARCLAADLSPRNLVLELTETQVVSDVPALGAVVARLRARGYRVSIDDVGPATRDPALLLRLPFSSVKLDIALVRATAREADARDYVRQLCTTAHAAGMIVVAEGIEDAESWGRMQALGADVGQGYAIARPLPAAAIPLWHRSWTAAMRAGAQAGAPPGPDPLPLAGLAQGRTHPPSEQGG